MCISPRSSSTRPNSGRGRRWSREKMQTPPASLWLRAFIFRDATAMHVPCSRSYCRTRRQQPQPTSGAGTSRSRSTAISRRFDRSIVLLRPARLNRERCFCSREPRRRNGATTRERSRVTRMRRQPARPRPRPTPRAVSCARRHSPRFTCRCGRSEIPTDCGRRRQAVVCCSSCRGCLVSLSSRDRADVYRSSAFHHE